jgi:hypothetical protein
MMKRITLLFMLFLLFVSGSAKLNAQSLVIRMLDGSETTEMLSSLQKLSFSGDNLLVSYKAGSSSLHPLSEIQKLYFGIPESIPEIAKAADNKLRIYPNPAGQIINLENLPEGTTVINIYRMDGKLMIHSMVYSNADTISISDLPGGIYLLIANNQSVKFIKL